MTATRTTLLGACLAAGLLTAAHAAPTYCSAPGGNTDGLAVTDMTYGTLPPAPAAATDCYGSLLGNDSAAGINALGLSWGSDWNFLVKDDAPGGPPNGTGSFGGVNFLLTSGAGSNGLWLLLGTGALPQTFDFIGVLKGGNRYAMYLFDDVVFDGSGGGQWSVSFTNAGGQTPDLSHFSLYVRNGGQVPEPGSLALAGLALAGLGALRRRRDSGH